MFSIFTHFAWNKKTISIIHSIIFGDELQTHQTNLRQNKRYLTRVNIVKIGSFWWSMAVKKTDSISRCISSQPYFYKFMAKLHLKRIVVLYRMEWLKKALSSNPCAHLKSNDFNNYVQEVLLVKTVFRVILGVSRWKLLIPVCRIRRRTRNTSSGCSARSRSIPNRPHHRDNQEWQAWLPGQVQCREGNHEGLERDLNLFFYLTPNISHMFLFFCPTDGATRIFSWNLFL